MNDAGAALDPVHVLCVGRNYVAHAEELGHDPPTSPLLFWKPRSSIARSGRVPIPRWAEAPTRIDYEGEVALVLDRPIGPGTPALPGDPWEAVRGIAAAVDVSDRTLQKLEPRWVRAKGFAGACGLGPLRPRPADPAGLVLRTHKNGEQVQEGRTAHLLFPFRDLLIYLHGFLGLEAGDVILTGTPAGVGPFTPGDRLRVSVHEGETETPCAELELEAVEGPAPAAFVRRTWPS